LFFFWGGGGGGSYFPFERRDTSGGIHFFVVYAGFDLTSSYCNDATLMTGLRIRDIFFTTTLFDFVGNLYEWEHKES